ncbi:sensor histidine kinase NtrY-like [Sphingomonas aerophila]|uniref:histidine kinase n=1 Tax=Sphingomonas aerophila TaxID=1344948 RepID=A0A7W9ETY1_9SPHN|nr:ATP-binding protein [Sphingomonas aerophila]MBB5714679.1 two-component system nitrogen regulation sensor histidine kinase NtrY [Sphingomonas aerophila]
MTAVATQRPDGPQPRRRGVTAALEVLVLAVAVGVALVSYLTVSRAPNPQQLLAPPLVALLLVANLVCDSAVIVLIGRAIARRRARKSPVGGEGLLHVRLVALFSVVAAVPMLLVTIAASLLFQYGVQFWYSDRARAVFENATTLTRQSYNQLLQRWEEATVTTAADIATELQRRPISGDALYNYLGTQLYVRSMSEGALMSVDQNYRVRVVISVNPYGIDPVRQLNREMLTDLRKGQRSVVNVTRDRIQTVTPVPGTDLVLYAARLTDPSEMQKQTARAEASLANYHALLVRARSLQVRFNTALLVLSLLIVAFAVWIALALADRLVRPVGELVDAARRVAGGDLTARVTDPRRRDEFGTLANAFNQMTERLQLQNSALVSANDQLDSRRALIEAVMAGVSAGVVATGEDRTIRIANASAVRLVGAGEELVGRTLGDVAPELDAMVAERQREAIIQVGERTLAARLARTEAGPILTFDDITQQQQDQRRAAWADVARRIAHEIKNPLTPIQLAAERLQRRYGNKVDEGDTTFGRLTETIVRQVGDLRRMVDEFSSFARMPKPEFKHEALLDTARQVMFLHEVAYPSITFDLRVDEPGPMLVCDRRQIGQALTNIVKNAAEAVEEKKVSDGHIVMAVREEPDEVVVEVEDNGIGLPAERDRIVEPYMTTRARGTGLGLAIVKKIIEEHHGTISFDDREGGGTRVTMRFDTVALAAYDDGVPIEPGQLATLTLGRT